MFIHSESLVLLKMHFLLHSNVSPTPSSPHCLLSHFYPFSSCCLFSLANYHDNPKGKVSLQGELNVGTHLYTAELCAVRVEVTP